MKINEFVSVLMHSRTQSHVYHLMTDSYTQHEAMKKYYKNIGGLIDSFVETYQGKTGRKIKEYITFNILNTNNTVKKYFLDLVEVVKKMKVTGNDLNNIKDEIESLINQVIYMLSLK